MGTRLLKAPGEKQSPAVIIITRKNLGLCSVSALIRSRRNQASSRGRSPEHRLSGGAVRGWVGTRGSQAASLPPSPRGLHSSLPATHETLPAFTPHPSRVRPYKARWSLRDHLPVTDHSAQRGSDCLSKEETPVPKNWEGEVHRQHRRVCARRCTCAPAYTCVIYICVRV